MLVSERERKCDERQGPGIKGAQCVLAKSEVGIMSPIFEELNSSVLYLGPVDNVHAGSWLHKINLGLTRKRFEEGVLKLRLLDTCQVGPWVSDRPV